MEGGYLKEMGGGGGGGGRGNVSLEYKPSTPSLGDLYLNQLAIVSHAFIFLYRNDLNYFFIFTQRIFPPR